MAASSIEGYVIQREKTRISIATIHAPKKNHAQDNGGYHANQQAFNDMGVRMWIRLWTLRGSGSWRFVRVMAHEPNITEGFTKHHFPQKRSEEIKMELIQNATVRLPEMNGQGVHVRGGYVVTAAHCLPMNEDDFQQGLLGDDFLVDIESAEHRVRACTIFADIVNDIAVLCTQYADPVYERFQKETPFLEVARTISVGEEMPIQVWSHQGFMMDGSAIRLNPSDASIYSTRPSIRVGSSGGPIVNDTNELIAVVSVVEDEREDGVDADGFHPLVWRTLPEFVRENV